MYKKLMTFAGLTLLAGILLAACATTPDVAELTDNEWVLDALVTGGTEATLEEGVTTTILFAEDGTYNGSGGCNSYSGTYTLDGNSISLGVAASTMMACETGMDQDAAFVCRQRDRAEFHG